MLRTVKTRLPRDLRLVKTRLPQWLGSVKIRQVGALWTVKIRLVGVLQSVKIRLSGALQAVNKYTVRSAPVTQFHCLLTRVTSDCTVDWGELAQRGELAHYSKFYINYFHFHYYSNKFQTYLKTNLFLDESCF